MRKNGFTLIELLAVIVILAIIALIATPIILGIINDAREESNERSIELYASAIRNGIAAHQLRGNEVAAGTYKSSDLTFVEYEGDVVCETIDIYEDGGVYVADCTVNEIAVEYTYGIKQVAKGTIGICNPLSVQTEGTYTAGDKYECDVDPNKEGYDYTFYVLNSTATEVNLIMDSNINISGQAVKEGVSDKGLVAWYADAKNNSYGPLTAMTYLQTATNGWTNTNELTINEFTDDEGGKHPMTEYVVNARMPYLSEVGATGCDITGDFNSATCPSWMLDYLADGGYQTNVVNDLYGYWTLSSLASGSKFAWYVGYDSYALSDLDVDDDFDFGVRPVINLSI